MSSIVSQQRRFGEDGVFCTGIASPDFATVAKGYGVAAFRVEETAAFGPAFAEALAHDGPALVHLKIDDRDVSPFTDEVNV